jgi:hypothetical protein
MPHDFCSAPNADAVDKHVYRGHAGTQSALQAARRAPTNMMPAVVTEPHLRPILSINMPTVTIPAIRPATCE